MDQEIKNIYLISQHNLGVGHLNRISVLAKFLQRIEGVKIWQISCGEPLDIARPDTKVNLVQLPALTLKSVSGIELVPADNNLTVDQVNEKRIEIIKELFRKNNPRVFITEFFPFSPHRLEETLLPVLKLKKDYPDCKIICSSRDIPICYNEKIDNKKKKHITNILNTYYDYLLVHSDASVQSISDIPKYRNLKITCHIIYTGYVVKDSNNRIVDNSSGKNVLVTVGGGRDGYKIISTAQNAAKDLPNVKFDLVCGPLMPKNLVEKVLYEKPGLSNVKVYPFINNLSTKFKNYDLIICAGGYNTLMEVVNNKIFAIVIPRKRSYEQVNRAKVLAKAGKLIVTNESTVNGKNLVKLIKKHIGQKPDMQKKIDLSGKKNTYLIIKKILNG